MKNKKENVLKDTHTPHIDKTEDNTTKSKEVDTEYAPGTHPHSKANLRPWSKGQSGNPLGKPSHAKLTKMLKEVGDEVVLDYHGKPIGTRKGTLIHFYSSGIAIALGVFFLTALPYIVFNLKFKLPKPFNITLVSGFKKKSNQTKKTEEDKYVVGDANWEIASNDDIESGDYNIE